MNKYNLYSIVNIDGELRPIIGSSSMATFMTEKGNAADHIRIKSFNSITELVKYVYFAGSESMHDILLSPCFSSYVSPYDIKALLEYSGDDDIINDVLEEFGFSSKIYNDKPIKPAEIEEEVEDDKEYCEYTVEAVFRMLYSNLKIKGYCAIVNNEWYILVTERTSSAIGKFYSILSCYDGYYTTENIHGVRLQYKYDPSDAMETDLYGKLIDWVASLPDINRNEAKEEVSDECEEYNDVECTDIVKMFSALEERLYNKGYNVKYIIAGRKCLIELIGIGDKFIYTTRQINVPLNCSLIAGDNCVFISAKKDIEVNYAVKKFYRDVLIWVNYLPNLPEPRTSTELAEGMKKFSAANHKDQEPIAVFNAFSEIRDELERKGYNARCCNYSDRYELSITFNYLRYKYIEELITIEYPPKMKAAFTNDSKNKCFIITLHAYDDFNYMEHELYEKLKAWAELLP